MRIHVANQSMARSLSGRVIDRRPGALFTRRVFYIRTISVALMPTLLSRYQTRSRIELKRYRCTPAPRNYKIYLD